MAFSNLAEPATKPYADRVLLLCCPAGNKIGGQTAALSCIYLVTAILSEMLTNNAAGAIMYPIAAATADQLGIGPNIMSVAV